MAVDQCLDGWAGSACKKLRYGENSLLSIDDHVDMLNAKDGLYATLVNNMRRYKDRLVIVRGKIQDLLPDIKNKGYTPEIIYLDANKSLDLLQLLHREYPDAILSGDDFIWKNNDRFPMQEAVINFSVKYNLKVSFLNHTWLIHPH